ncbi:FAD:protein FMN transferase [Eubacterium barkeri]|nr:FAD:protein FMN transferase [Eubacterium barkeri]
MCPSTNKDFFRVLTDGRVYVDYGPVSMVLSAMKNGVAQPSLCAAHAQAIPGILEEIAEVRDQLCRYPAEIHGKGLRGLPLEMVETVRRVGEPTLTPMATVAGTVADCVADQLFKEDVDTVIVNNGGDIALRLRRGASIRMGILPDLAAGQITQTITLTEEDGIGGVCTSGLGGRSFTRGIANAVTVFSKRCMIADACATHLANTSYVACDGVITARAGDIKRESDIAELQVVTQVGVLSDGVRKKSLKQIEAEAVRQARMGNVAAVFADVGGTAMAWHPNEV